MTTPLVNGLYPIDYFTLAGVDQVQYPHEYWWQSKLRYALDGGIVNGALVGEPTSEYLEIDLSRIRQVNYLNMSVLKAPIDMTVQYDAVSDTDEGHRWVSVTPADHEPFDDQTHYNAGHRSSWQDCEFYFTDSQGKPINTRFIRIRFKRRNVEWPTNGAKPFRWSVMVRNLRVARFVNEYGDTRGTVFDSGVPDDSAASHVLMGITDTDYATDGVLQSDWVKQQFGLPPDYRRGTGDNAVDPKLMGFSMMFYIEPNQPTVDFDDMPNESLVELQWKLYDKTNDVLLRSGFSDGALTDRRGWVNVYFDPEDAIATNPDSHIVYEVWVKSLSVHVTANNGVRQIMGKFIRQPRAVSGLFLGNAVFTNGSATVTFANSMTGLLVHNDLIQRTDRIDAAVTVNTVVGTTVTLTAVYPGESGTLATEKVLPVTVGAASPDFTNSACLHLWADVGDNGRDVLGNQYRYATHPIDPTNVVTDGSVGWTSEPKPSPHAVESLYFDVRSGGLPQTIDAITIAPRTPGIHMHVYSTDYHTNSDVPQNSSQWDHMLWQPINATYHLNGRQTITFPKPLRANFIKLEFSKLQPRPLHVPARPDSPFSEFKRYPTWIETQYDNSQVRRTVEDWFHDQSKKGLVRIDALQFVRSPILEFEYREREFFAAIATNKAFDKDARNSGLIDTKTNTFIDPVSASRINLNTTRMFQAPLTLSTDRTSLLGELIANQTDPRINQSVREGGFEVSRGIPNVSSSRGRVSESFAHLAQTPMWFNRETRHIYKHDKAKFGKQAYYAGISFVEFSRIDYTVTHDDEQITEYLYDNVMLDENSWVQDKPSRIANLVGTTSTISTPGTATDLLVTYTIDGVTTTDEVITFSYLAQNVRLLNAGSDPAIGMQVFLKQPDGSRGTPCFHGIDYDVHHTIDVDSGFVVNTMSINTLQHRLVVGHIDANYDAGLVVGRAVIGSVEVYAPQQFLEFADSGSGSDAITTRSATHTDSGTGTNAAFSGRRTTDTGHGTDAGTKTP